MRWLYWIAAIVIYWCSALWLLFRVFRIFIDSGGAVASLYWGKHLMAAGLAEYQRSAKVRLAFLCPYWGAATIISLVGCVLTPWLIALWRPARSRTFLVSSETTLLLLLLMGAISDAGTATHIWEGPRMYSTIYNVCAFLKIMVPMSLFAGAVAFVRGRLDTKAH